MTSQFPQPGGPPGSDEAPSEEEVRQYLAQMRGAPVDQVVAEVVQGLLNAVQVKLGRNDARLLIDLASTVNDTARGRVSEQLVDQVDQALSQLRLAQVEAEREAAGHEEPNDVPAAGQAASGPEEGGPAPSQPGQEPQQQPSQTSKLWIPGR